MSINDDQLAAEYAAGDSIPIVASRHGVPLSRVRTAAERAGVLRSRAAGVRMAAEEGRLGGGMRGKQRTFTAEHKDAIRRSAIERGERTAAGRSLKPNGYVEITRGPNKGRGEHRVMMEQAIGRKLLRSEVVHHKDHVRSNNSHDNLELMSLSEHASLHRKGEI